MFKEQELYFKLISIPTKIEIKGKLKNQNGLGEKITIGFIHDNIKNTFVIKKMLAELSKNGDYQLLEERSFVEDYNFL